MAGRSAPESSIPAPSRPARQDAASRRRVAARERVHWLRARRRFQPRPASSCRRPALWMWSIPVIPFYHDSAVCSECVPGLIGTTGTMFQRGDAAHQLFFWPAFPTLVGGTQPAGESRRFPERPETVHSTVVCIVATCLTRGRVSSIPETDEGMRRMPVLDIRVGQQESCRFFYGCHKGV